jgi:hypothetical protein
MRPRRKATRGHDARAIQDMTTKAFSFACLRRCHLKKSMVCNAMSQGPMKHSRGIPRVTRAQPMKRQLSIGAYRAARRVRAVDAYEFPFSVGQRLRRTHPDLRTEDVALVEAATRQWFRILARRPTARVWLAMPSTLADDMWHEFLLHTRDYAAFCDTAFRRFLHHLPESAITPEDAVPSPTSRLLATLRLAREDENNPSALPVLFRVDHEAGFTRPLVTSSTAVGERSATPRQPWTWCACTT